MTRLALICVGAAGLVACQGGSTSDTTSGLGDTAATTDTAWTPTCTSGSHWTYGNSGSENMRPGHDCISCHASGEGPNFAMAGTVMGALHDEDDCDGVSGVTVHITDAAGTVHDFTSNGAGNFSSRSNISMPYTASVEYQGNVVEMFTPQNTLNCNQCHTVAGANGAPGRIVAP